MDPPSWIAVILSRQAWGLVSYSSLRSGLDKMAQAGAEQMSNKDRTNFEQKRQNVRRASVLEPPTGEHPQRNRPATTTAYSAYCRTTSRSGSAGSCFAINLANSANFFRASATDVPSNASTRFASPANKLYHSVQEIAQEQCASVNRKRKGPSSRLNSRRPASLIETL